jgi:hypothetical protein
LTNALKVLTKLLPKDTKQATTTKSITTDKNSDFDSMIAQAVGLAKLTLTWAKDNKMASLISALTVTISSFDGAEVTAVALAKTILKIVTDNQVQLVLEADINNDQVTTFSDAILKAEAEIGTPISQRGLNKTVGISIEDAFAAVDESVGTIQTLLEGRFAKGLPNENTLLISDMVIALKLHIVKRFTALHIFFTDVLTGQNIEGVAIAIPELKKTGISDIDGLGKIPSMKPVKSHASFSHPMYKIVEEDVVPLKGKTVVMNVKMKLL